MQIAICQKLNEVYPDDIYGIKIGPGDDWILAVFNRYLEPNNWKREAFNWILTVFNRHKAEEKRAIVPYFGEDDAITMSKEICWAHIDKKDYYVIRENDHYNGETDCEEGEHKNCCKEELCCEEELKYW